MPTFFRALPVTPLLLVVLLVIGQNTRQASATVYKVTPSGKWTSSSGFSSNTKVCYCKLLYVMCRLLLLQYILQRTMIP